MVVLEAATRRGSRGLGVFRAVAGGLAAGFLLASIDSAALAQAPARAKTAAEAAAERTRETINKAKLRGARKGVLRLEGDVIEGKVQKPEAFYLLQRTSLSFEGLQLKTRLAPKIVRSLQKSPF